MKQIYILATILFFVCIKINAQTTDVVTGVNVPQGIVLNGNELYIAEKDGNKVSKIDITTLSIEDNILKPRIQLYPNPANDYFQLSNLTAAEGYTIYNMLGAKIKSSNISINEKIDIQNLTNGIYFLKLDNGNALKFIKE